MFVLLLKRRWESILSKTLWEGRKRALCDIKRWNSTQDAKQVDLKTQFNFAELENISLQIVSDYDCNVGETYAYIDDNYIPNDNVIEMLIHVFNFLSQSKCVAASKVEMSLKLQNPSVENPNLFLKEESTLETQWQLIFKNMTPENYELISCLIQGITPFKGKVFTVHDK